MKTEEGISLRRVNDHNDLFNLLPSIKVLLNQSDVTRDGCYGPHGMVITQKSIQGTGLNRIILTH